MLTKFIVSVFSGMIEAMLWLVLIGAAIGGWVAMHGFLGAIVGLVVGLVIDLGFFGVLLLMLDIRNSLTRIEQAKS